MVIYEFQTKIIGIDMTEVQKALLKRFEKVHPMVLKRSLEYAKTDGELFDILSEVELLAYPVSWDKETRRWKNFV